MAKCSFIKLKIVNKIYLLYSFFLCLSQTNLVEAGKNSISSKSKNNSQQSKNIELESINNDKSFSNTQDNNNIHFLTQQNNNNINSFFQFNNNSINSFTQQDTNIINCINQQKNNSIITIIKQNDKNKNLLNIIKSKFILKKIIDPILRIKKYNLVKYNKKLQKKLNMKLSEYEILSKICSDFKKKQVIDLQLTIDSMFTNETFAEEYIKNIVGKGYVLKKVYNNIEIDPYDTKKEKYILYTIQKGCSNFVKKITVIYKFLVLGEKNMNNNQQDDYSELIRFISKFRDRKLNICSKKKIIENKIEVKIEPKNENFKIGTNMFKGCKNITVIDLSNCNNKNVTDMSGMSLDVHL